MDGQVAKDADAIAQLQANREIDAQAFAALKQQLVDANDRVLAMSKDLQAAQEAQAKATADLKSCTDTLAAANAGLAKSRREIEEQKAAAAEQSSKEKSWVASQLQKMTDAETAKIVAEKALAAMQTQRTSDEKEKEALLEQLKDDKDRMMALANEFQVFLITCCTCDLLPLFYFRLLIQFFFFSPPYTPIFTLSRMQYPCM